MMNIQLVWWKYVVKKIYLAFNELQILSVDHIFMPDLINNFIHKSQPNIFLFLDV